MMSDLISRQDAIDALGEEPPVWYDGDDEIAERNQWRRDKAAIESLPSAEPKTGEWIPVSDRLPKARESVILSTKEWTGEGCYWETTKHHVIWKGYGWNATYWDDEVIAWMPLPPVYQGE